MMPAKRPEDLHHLFVAAFNAADTDALIALYETGAVLAAQPDASVAGTDAIRLGLDAFLSMKGRIVIETARVIPVRRRGAAAWKMVAQRHRARRSACDDGRPEHRGRATAGGRNLAFRDRQSVFLRLNMRGPVPRRR